MTLLPLLLTLLGHLSLAALSPPPVKRALLVIWLRPVHPPLFNQHPALRELQERGFRFPRLRLKRGAGVSAFFSGLNQGNRRGQRKAPRTRLLPLIEKKRGWASWQVWVMSAGSTLPAGLGSAAELTSLSLLPLWDQVLRQPGKGRAALPPRQGLSLFKTRRKSAPPEHGRLPQMLRRKTSAALLQDLLDPKLRKTPAGPNRALIRLAGSLVKSLDEGLVVAFLTESASRKIPSPSRLLSEELLELAQVAQSLRLGARGDTLLALALARPRTKVKRTPSQTLLSSLLLIGPGIPADQSQKRSVHPEQFGATLAHLFGLRGVRGLAPLLPGLFK